MYWWVLTLPTISEDIRGYLLSQGSDQLIIYLGGPSFPGLENMKYHNLIYINIYMYVYHNILSSHLTQGVRFPCYFAQPNFLSPHHPAWGVYQVWSILWSAFISLLLVLESNKICIRDKIWMHGIEFGSMNYHIGFWTISWLIQIASQVWKSHSGWEDINLIFPLDIFACEFLETKTIQWIIWL